jgi:hypothetical protein
MVKAESGERDDVATYEDKLADYLQERIKPGLNSGAIPLLARSIAKEIATWERPADPVTEADDEGEEREPEDDQPKADADEDEPTEADEDEDEDEPTEPDDEPAGESDGVPDFEADMHDLQAELGNDWIVRFSVQGDDAWLTAEKDDGSQRLEAPTAAVLVEAVQLINDGGGRSG